MFFWFVVVPVLCSLSFWSPRLLCALRPQACPLRLTILGAPGVWLWCLSAHCTCRLLCPWLAAHFLPLLFGSPRAPLCLMSRGDELRQLAAQLSVLAALEDSIALGLSRVMGPAGSGRSAAPPDAGSPSAPAAIAAPSVVPSPSHEVAASLLRSSSRARTRSRSPAPLPKRAPRSSSSTASGLRGSVALAESGLVTGLATKCCPPVPPPQLRLSRVSRALHAASVGSQPPVDASGALCTPQPRPLRPPVLRRPRPTPMMTGTLSLTHTAWPRLLVAPRPAVAQPAEAAGASRRGSRQASPSPAQSPPSAPCGEKFDVLSLVLCAFSAEVASLAVGFCPGHVHTSEGHGEVLVVVVFFCGSGAGRGLFLALLALARGEADSAEKPNKSYYDPRKWWPSSLAKGLHRCRICCSWTSLLCQWVWRLQVVS